MKTHKVVGLMSGTSLDGLDLAYCHIKPGKAAWQYELKEVQSMGYSPDLREQLKNAIFLDGEKLLHLHNQYGRWLGEQARRFIKEHKLDVDYISSHGHTSHHQPQKGLTFQLGSGQHLALASGHTTVCDFRTLDVALGGQGAPLVPIGDRLFFGEYDFCLNLGGISNVSFELKGERIAYDIGLANMILNYLCRNTDRGFDEDGALARSGSIIPSLFNRLNNLEYYALPYPKSTGYEWFLQEVVPLIENTEGPLEDLLHTAIIHICEQICLQLEPHISGRGRTLLVTGGGALNIYLLEVLQKRLPKGIELVVPHKRLIEFKEALVFALMGALRMEGKTNVLGSVTGARSDSSSGVVYLP